MISVLPLLWPSTYSKLNDLSICLSYFSRLHEDFDTLPSILLITYKVVFWLYLMIYVHNITWLFHMYYICFPTSLVIPWEILLATLIHSYKVWMIWSVHPVSKVKSFLIWGLKISGPVTSMLVKISIPLWLHTTKCSSLRNVDK